MKPRSIGRTLGIGLRVAGRVAGQHLGDSADATQSAVAPGAGLRGGENAPAQASEAAAGGSPSHMAGRIAGQAAARGPAGLARGMGGFVRPFRRVGGILWLEVTGVFFLLFVVAFAPTLWRARASWAHGPEHRTFVVAAAIVAVFLYLSLSSFWRARRK